MKIQRRQIIQAMLIVTVIAMLAGSGYAMAQPKRAKLWECNNCKQQRWEEHKPDNAGCTGTEIGLHSWFEKK